MKGENMKTRGLFLIGILSALLMTSCVEVMVEEGVGGGGSSAAVDAKIAKVAKTTDMNMNKISQDLQRFDQRIRRIEEAIAKIANPRKPPPKKAPAKKIETPIIKPPGKKKGEGK